MNGFLISQLNRIPYEDETEEVSANGYHFKILEVSQNVVRKVCITKEIVVEEVENDTDKESKE